MHELGVIHGRFQVLHNDHLAYLLAGKNQCRHLVIGITNPDPVRTLDEDADPDRSSTANNPLTYWERFLMIRQALVAADISLEEFSIVPFPINEPDLYHHYVPLDAVFFLTIYDNWGRTKKKRFEQLGLQTHVLWEKTPDQKGISGTDVRQYIRSNQDISQLVPASTLRLIKKWKLAERLQV